MRINDRIIGLIAMLGGIGIIVGTLGFRTLPGQQFGSAFFPQILGGVLILCGATMAARRDEASLIKIGPMLRGRDGLKVLAVLLSVILWVWLSPYLGFVATTALLIAALAILAGGAVQVSCMTGIGMAIVLFYIFGALLRVPLPYGSVEGWLP